MKIFIVFFLIFFTVIPSFGQDFVRGADIGWLSEMENEDQVFYNDDGIEEDVLDILHDHCMNSIRLRVWVNPENAGNYSGKEDVIAQAKRAYAKGFRIMIDFHYSDNWADPGKQYKPAAWEQYSVAELTQAVYDHTYDVLNALKNEGVTPEWVQIGNETNDGMLWETGRASAGGMTNYANFISSGHSAAKAVFPDIITVVHVANGWDNSLFQWNIGGLINAGAQFDAIGMSLYPEPGDWQTMTANCLTNMQDMISQYNKAVMISEIGMSWSYETEAKAFVEDIITKNQSLGSMGLGVFWWEPQCYNWVGYDKGTWNPNTQRPTIALDGFMINCTQNTDCNGVENGTAYIDDCGVCVGGTSGREACIPVDVTFTVDMSGADVSQGIYVTGDMTESGGNWSIIEMTDNGNNTYSVTFSMMSGEEGGYYFLNGNDWANRETVPPECVGMYESDRTYLIPRENTEFISIWNSCDNIQVDCNSIAYGSAYIDGCGNCVGGTTGLEACRVIELTTGWNVIGYPVAEKQSVEQALTSVWENLEIVKDMESFYSKQNNPALQSLTEMEWGKGYLIKVDADCQLRW
jgi:arabinogalactan endo-1,4-beta-galactosidase